MASPFANGKHTPFFPFYFNSRDTRLIISSVPAKYVEKEGKSTVLDSFGSVDWLPDGGLAAIECWHLLAKRGGACYMQGYRI